MACSTADAAGGRIMLYADESRQGCELVDTYPGIVQIHIFYEGDLGANSVLFYAPTPDCWTDAVWIGDVIFDPWLAGLGDSHDSANGALINFRGCETGPVHIGYMSFQAMGRGEKCCTYEFEATTNNDVPGVIDCTSAFAAVETGALVVNPHGGCRCEDGNVVVATSETTWGHVKALYR
jgi:hypothetical protein